jgi:dienelactone hydrolase
MNRKKIGEILLLNGQDYMAFNIRGTGRSQGKPTEQRTYEDIETVYQFLKSKGYSDDQISVYGYCLGSGLAVNLASTHPVHLILDRPFAKIADVAASAATEMTLGTLKIDSAGPRLSKFIAAVNWALAQGLNWTVISYDNLSKLSRVQGSILFIHSGIDEVIPEPSREAMRKKVEKIAQKRGDVKIQVSNVFGHNDLWDIATNNIAHSHFANTNTLREYPKTHRPPNLPVLLDPLDKLNCQIVHENEKVDANIQASKAGFGMAGGAALAVAAGANPAPALALGMIAGTASAVLK